MCMSWKSSIKVRRTQVVLSVFHLLLLRYSVIFCEYLFSCSKVGILLTLFSRINTGIPLLPFLCKMHKSKCLYSRRKIYKSDLFLNSSIQLTLFSKPFFLNMRLMSSRNTCRVAWFSPSQAKKLLWKSSFEPSEKLNKGNSFNLSVISFNYICTIIHAYSFRDFRLPPNLGCKVMAFSKKVAISFYIKFFDNHFK